MKIRHPIIGANWKMNKSLAESVSTARTLAGLLDALDDRTVFINVPFTAIAGVRDIFHASGILVGAQDVFWKDWGAYTGEISAPMLKEIGADVAMIGHSERRETFGETDETVNLKLKALLKNDLIPAVCIGEKHSVHQANRTFEFLTSQLEAVLDGVEGESIRDLIISYEPIWSIGSDLPLLPEQASEVHAFIRMKLAEMYAADILKRVHVICGGSINTKNAKSLACAPNIDGIFIGRASLNASSFAQIIYWDRQ